MVEREVQVGLPVVREMVQQEHKMERMELGSIQVVAEHLPMPTSVEPVDNQVPVEELVQLAQEQVVRAGMGKLLSPQLLGHSRLQAVLIVS